MPRITPYLAKEIVRWTVLVLLLAILGSCRQDTVITPNPDELLEFEVCPQALALPDSKRGFQGLQGWFFFNYDFREKYETITPEQASFVVQLNRAFVTQGVLLVVVPVPARGAIKPSVLYLADLKQVAFSPAAIQDYYDAYIETLEQNGVAVVNVLAQAIAFDARGGQTFFKRDLHWTPEGANMVAQATAREIQKRLSEPLTETPLVLERKPRDQAHPGRFMNNWLYGACKMTLPPEPLGDYTVSRPRGAEAAEVVQAGSSFGGQPFDQGFLGVALQSKVSNVSVGNGGALFALESYLESRDYQKARPRVLVWEFPAAGGALGVSAQRRLLAGAYGICTADAAQFQQTTAADTKTIFLTQPANAPEHYLTFAFNDPSLLHFEASLHYKDGSSETLVFNRPEQIASRNQGRYFTTLLNIPTALETIELNIPATTGEVSVQVCRTP